MIKIRRGLKLPIAGEARQTIENGPTVRSVALLGADYEGMKPTMAVKVGDRVKIGQLLFTDKKTPGVKYTAPASGTVSAINRGQRRVLQSVVIDVGDTEDAEIFAAYPAGDLAAIPRQAIVDNLVNSGLWNAFLTRPFNKVPAVASETKAIFVSLMNMRPDIAGRMHTRKCLKNDLFAMAFLSNGQFCIRSMTNKDFAT